MNVLYATGETTLPPTDFMEQLKWHKKQLQTGTYMCSYIICTVATYVFHGL